MGVDGTEKTLTVRQQLFVNRFRGIEKKEINFCTRSFHKISIKSQIRKFLC